MAYMSGIRGGVLTYPMLDELPVVGGDGLFADSTGAFSWGPVLQTVSFNAPDYKTPITPAHACSQGHTSLTRPSLVTHDAAEAVRAFASVVSQDDGACDALPELCVPEPWVLQHEDSILDVLCGKDDYASVCEDESGSYYDDDTDGGGHGHSSTEGSRERLAHHSTSNDSDTESYSSHTKTGLQRSRRPVSDLTVEIPVQCRGDGELGWSRYLLELPTVDLNQWLKTADLPIQASGALKALRRRIKNRRYTQVARIRKGSSSPGGRGGDEATTNEFGCKLVTPRRTKSTSGKSKRSRA